MDIQLKKGIYEICVLAALYREASYGYKIVEDLKNLADISESTLYPILKRLEKAGCLYSYSQEYNGRLRRYYSITDEGRQRITDFLEQWRTMERLYAFIKRVEEK